MVLRDLGVRGAGAHVVRQGLERLDVLEGLARGLDLLGVEARARRPGGVAQQRDLRLQVALALLQLLARHRILDLVGGDRGDLLLERLLLLLGLLLEVGGLRQGFDDRPLDGLGDELHRRLDDLPELLAEGVLRVDHDLAHLGVAGNARQRLIEAPEPVLDRVLLARHPVVGRGQGQAPDRVDRLPHERLDDPALERLPDRLDPRADDLPRRRAGARDRLVQGGGVLLGLLAGHGLLGGLRSLPSSVGPKCEKNETTTCFALPSPASVS